MSQPTQGDLYVNPLLTNVSIAYVQQASNFIADQVFPVIPVSLQGGTYRTYTKANWFRSDAALRAPGAESTGTGFEVGSATYFAPVYAIHDDISDQDRANEQAPLKLDTDSTNLVTNQLLLKREALWVSNYFGTSIWGTDLTGVSGSPGAGEFKQWDASGSTPIKDIKTQILAMAAATGFRPNTLVLGPYVFNTLSDHADVLSRIQYTQRAVVTTDILASLLGIERVLVPYATQNTAAENIAASMGFTYGKGALLCYAAPNPGLKVPTAGYTFAWTGYLGADASAARIKRFRLERNAADRIEGEMAFDQKVVATDLGVYFTTAVS